MGEALGALGLAWPRLLLYPGGLSALLGAWLLARWLGRNSPTSAASLVDLLPPLLALSLLPLPPARAFPYGLDLPTSLALLLWPWLRALAQSGEIEPGRLRVRAPGGALLLLAMLLLAEGAGAIELSALLRAPTEGWRWALLIAGGLAWIGAVQRLGALRGGDLSVWLGAWGLLLVGALPLLGGLAELLAGRLPEGWAGWLLPPLAALIAALFAGALARLGKRP